jgi:pyridoxamine 5'-phosphate oxidase
MEINPIEYFKNLFNEELSQTKLRIPAACCLSTIGTDGFPNARFVSLKEVTDQNFIITGTLTSRKGTEIAANEKVALTFWWTETERQVRIQGHATQIPGKLADRYFSERNRGSQIVSIVSEQGNDIDDIAMLHRKYTDLESACTGQPLKKPEGWGGYSIAPSRIEFLEFKTSRFHDRKLFELINGKWAIKQLQP